MLLDIKELQYYLKVWITIQHNFVRINWHTTSCFANFFKKLSPNLRSWENFFVLVLNCLVVSINTIRDIHFNNIVFLQKNLVIYQVCWQESWWRFNFLGILCLYIKKVYFIVRSVYFILVYLIQLYIIGG
jgi:hypothetical protein